MATVTTTPSSICYVFFYIRRIPTVEMIYRVILLDKISKWYGDKNPRTGRSRIPSRVVSGEFWGQYHFGGIYTIMYRYRTVES